MTDQTLQVAIDTRNSIDRIEKIISCFNELKKLQLIFRATDENDYSFLVEDQFILTGMKQVYMNKLDVLKNAFEKL